MGDRSIEAAAGSRPSPHDAAVGDGGASGRRELRILHISTRLILGGSQENTVLSCEGQAGRGHDVHLAFGPIYGPEGTMLPRVERWNRDHPAAPVTPHEIPDMVREVSPRRDRRCLAQLQRLIDELDPDVVHTHSSKAGVLGRLAAWSRWRRRGRPAVVHTIHGPPFMPVEGGARRRLAVRAKNAAYAAAERAAARRCHAVASVADAMTDAFLARRIGRPGLYTTVRSGMDSRPFLAPAPGESRAEVRAGLDLRESPEPALVVGTVARLADHKGHDDILSAVTMPLEPGGPSIADRVRNLVLLWVGDGWRRAALEDRIERLGLTDRVRLTGLVGPERIPGLMRAMDVLVHASAREGLPRTVPQAFLAKTAVVATDADGTREVVHDEVTGRLVPVGDPAALARALWWMLDGELGAARRAQTAAAGHALATRLFDAETMINALDRLYAEALDRAQHSDRASANVIDRR